MGYQAHTKKGYNLFEVASALQKSIRRNEEDQALYWAVELYTSGYDNYLWKRLRIICSEDVGLAEPNMPANIQALWAMYQEQRKMKDEKHAPERLFLIQAVLMLCRAQKSRLVDWVLIATFGEHEDRNLPLPDYAYDKHNQKGRTMGRGWDHFFEEGTRLNPHIDLPGEAEAKVKARSAISIGKIAEIKRTGQASMFDEEDGDAG